MRNPIFSVDTLFLDQANNGSFRHLTGVESTTLTYGERLIRLETRQPLIEITMDSGKTLVMAPETAFALTKDEHGNLIRYSPVDESMSDLKYAVDWSAPIDLDNDSDLRRWVIIGKVCANGTHNLERHRPSNLTVKARQAPVIRQYLEDIWNLRNPDLKGRRGVKDVYLPDGNVFIKSSMIAVLVGGMLSPKTQGVNFDPAEMSLPCLWAFFYGLLSSCAEQGETLIFSNRVADTVRLLSNALFTYFGIPNSLSIHPLEREVLTQKSHIATPHTFTLSAEQRNFAYLVGLDSSDTFAKIRPSFLFTDKISKIRPLDAQIPSVIVMPGTGRKTFLTANSFVFSPVYVMPEKAADLAAHPDFIDSSDPATF